MFTSCFTLAHKVLNYKSYYKSSSAFYLAPKSDSPLKVWIEYAMCSPCDLQKFTICLTLIHESSKLFNFHLKVLRVPHLKHRQQLKR